MRDRVFEMVRGVKRALPRIGHSHKIQISLAYWYDRWKIIQTRPDLGWAREPRLTNSTSVPKWIAEESLNQNDMEKHARTMCAAIVATAAAASLRADSRLQKLLCIQSHRPDRRFGIKVASKEVLAARRNAL